MRLVLLLGLILWPVFAMAEAVPKAVPKAVAKAVARDENRYVDEVSVLINGFGKGGAIDRQGLQNAVAMARAEARATALHRLQGADLDGDGAITGAELQVTSAAAAATARGRLVLYFGKADSDADGSVSAAELQDYATRAALQTFGTDKAAAIYSILDYDGNKDGLVTMPEVKLAVSALAASAKAAPAKVQQQL